MIRILKIRSSASANKLKVVTRALIVIVARYYRVGTKKIRRIEKGFPKRYHVSRIRLVFLNPPSLNFENSLKFSFINFIQGVIRFTTRI